MSDIDKILETMRERAAGYGRLRGEKEIADERLKIVYAMLYDEIPEQYTTAPQRDAWVKRQPRYQEAVEAKATAHAAWTEADVYVKCAFAQAEVWRSKEASKRMIDGAHR